MATPHEPAKKPVNTIRKMTDDERAKRRAFVLERARHDEASLLYDAREEGWKQGFEEGRKQGIEEVRVEELRGMARKMIALELLTDEQIAAATGLTLIEIQQLR